MEAPAGVCLQPVLDFLGAAGREVVGDGDDLLVLDEGDLGVALVEEADQVEAVACLGWHSEHVAFLDLETGEEALGAVAGVFVLAPSRLARLRRQVGLHRCFRLDPGLLVDRDDYCKTFSGGLRYKPQISRNRCSNSGWAESLITQ